MVYWSIFMAEESRLQQIPTTFTKAWSLAHLLWRHDIWPLRRRFSVSTSTLEAAKPLAFSLVQSELLGSLRVRYRTGLAIVSPNELQSRANVDPLNLFPLHIVSLFPKTAAATQQCLTSIHPNPVTDSIFVWLNAFVSFGTLWFGLKRRSNI